MTQAETATRRARIQSVIGRIVAEGSTESTHDGSTHDIFPVAVSPEEAAWLQDWICREKPERTIEIGLGYGVSALHICDGLLANGCHDAKHIVIDPFQEKRFSCLGLHHLEAAGVRDMVEYLDEQSQTALPRYLKDGDLFDFAFVDGNHHFDFVFVDLFYLARLLRKGSLVVLDDFNWPGIQKAVSFCVTNLKWTIEAEFDSSVAVRTSLEPDKRPGTYLVDF